MEVYFISNTNRKNELNKVVSLSIIKNGHLKDACSVTNPEIEFEVDADLMNYAYFFIPAFARFYFLTGRTVSGKKMSISMHCDVLMSFKDDIKNSVGTVTRSMKGNDFIADNMILNLPKITRRCKKLASLGTNENPMYLVQIGG